MTPAPGISRLRRIATQEMIGSIIAPEQARDRLTCQQFEVVAMGAPEVCEDLDECNRIHGEGDTHLQPELPTGTWVLVSSRSWVDAPDGTVFVRTDAMLGVLTV